MRYLLEQPQTLKPQFCLPPGVHIRNAAMSRAAVPERAVVPGPQAALPALPHTQRGRKTILGSKAKEKRSASDADLESWAPLSPYLV